MHYVIGVAGHAGAGKTSLVRALLHIMPDAAAIHIDNYQQITKRPLRELVRWMNAGGDYDRFPIPHLDDHLASLKRGVPVIDPATGQEIAPHKYLLFETHFGRAHRATGRHIDLLLWVETPLDVALARNVRDFLSSMLHERDAAACADRAAWIYNYLGSYLDDTRRLVTHQKDTVAAEADLVLDYAAGIQGMASIAEREIRGRLP